MNNLNTATEHFIKGLIRNDEIVIMSKESFQSLLATVEEDSDTESQKARSEAEKDIKINKLTPLEEISL